MPRSLDHCPSCARLNNRDVNPRSSYCCNEPWPDNEFQTARVIAGP